MRACGAWLLPVVLPVVLAVGSAGAARAQQPGADPSRAVVREGWSFNVSPYLWAPWIDTKVSYKLPSVAARMPSSFNVAFGDYFSNIHFAAMLTGEARNGRFSVVTDVAYLSLVANSFNTRFKSLSIPGQPDLPLNASSSLGSQTSLDSTIWTLAGGYTVLDGEWGHVDLIAGFRLLGLNTSTRYNLGVTVTGPAGGGATYLGSGGTSASGDIWNGIGGVRGMFRFSGSNWYIPYYFDIGAGGSNLTWQISGGVGYQKGPVGISLLYRYLTFQQGSSNTIREMSMGGPLAMLNFSF